MICSGPKYREVTAMNLPNKLTVFRIILIPIFIAVYLWGTTVGTAIALGVFALASFTDYLDGHLARKNNQITTFGKLMDPVADKILTMTALICFVQNHIPYINAPVVIVILARELIVTGIRMVALHEGTVIAASKWGKAKTVSQITLIVWVMVYQLLAGFLPQSEPVCRTVIAVLVVIVVVITIYSGWDYIHKNRQMIHFC